MPDKKVMQKFNSLFEGENILEYLKKFEKYYRIKYLDEKVKYLLLNKIIKEISIYIEKIEPVNDRDHLKSIKANLNDFRDKNQNNIPAYPSAVFIKKNDV